MLLALLNHCYLYAVLPVLLNHLVNLTDFVVILYFVFEWRVGLVGMLLRLRAGADVAFLSEIDSECTWVAKRLSQRSVLRDFTTLALAAYIA